MFRKLTLLFVTLLVFVPSSIITESVHLMGLEEFESEYDPVKAKLLTKDPDISASFETLVNHHSDTFTLEIHKVTTDDNYVLTVYRIKVKIPPPAENRKPVILVHGFMGTATHWIVNSPYLYAGNNNPNSSIGDNLGFNLALTNRYDVWVVNVRGNDNPTTKVKKFWQFSFEQIALFDIPAVIQYVMAKTERKTVGLIGFSLGTTCTFILLGKKPGYADIIQPFIALAPVYFTHHIDVPLFKILSPLAKWICGKNGEFSYSGLIPRNIIILICRYDMFLVCPKIIHGYHINKTRIPVFVSQIAVSTSDQNICHLSQWFMSKNLSRYDFGSIQANCNHYHVPVPPLFEVQNISSTAKIALFSSRNDATGPPGDVESLRMALTEQAGIRLIANRFVEEGLDLKWSHLDFMFGTGAGKLFHLALFDILDKYTRP